MSGAAALGSNRKGRPVNRKRRSSMPFLAAIAPARPTRPSVAPTSTRRGRGVAEGRAGRPRAPPCGRDSGSISGMALIPLRPAVLPEQGEKRVRDHAGPFAGSHIGEERDHRVGLHGNSGTARVSRDEEAVDDPAVLHVRREQAQRQSRGFAPAHRGQPVEACAGRGEQNVSLPIKGVGPYVAQRLVVQIGQSGVQLRGIKPALDFDRAATTGP